MDIFDQTSVGQAITSTHVSSKSSLGYKYLESFVGLHNEDQLSKVVKHGYKPFVSSGVVIVYSLGHLCDDSRRGLKLSERYNEKRECH